MKDNASPAPGFVIDMDGVVYRGSQLIPGARDFVDRLTIRGCRFLFLTNNSEKTPEELQRKLARLGITVGTDHFFTSSMATAAFLQSQRPGARVFALGGEGLRRALTEAGLRLTDRGPDYVVVGNPADYHFDGITRAIRLVQQGALLIGTNPDLSGPTEKGLHPGCGALIKPIELVTGRRPYFIGKPNPLMMRMALRRLGLHSTAAYMVGDRMDTDIQAGLEAGLGTILVLSGVTSRREMGRFAYRPRFIYNHVGEIPVASLS
jgi:NagD protein